jgi:hypothetical protein
VWKATVRGLVSGNGCTVAIYRLGPLNETLVSLKAALDQLDKVDAALGTFINSSSSNSSSRLAAARRHDKRQVVVTTVTTVEVITVVTQYQSIIVSAGTFF